MRALLFISVLFQVVFFVSFLPTKTLAQVSHPPHRIVTAMLQIKTSHIPDAETEGPIYTVIMGKQGTTKSLSLGNFERGGLIRNDLVLDKDIGDVQSIHFYTNSTDGWRMNNVMCEFNGKRYQFAQPLKWLDTFDVELFRKYGNGYSKEYIRESESEETMVLPVISVKNCF